MRNKKIVYVIGSASIGGAELQMLQLSKLVKENGWHCEIWFLKIGSGIVAHYATDLDIKWQSFNFQKKYKNPINLLFGFIKLIIAINQTKPDIVQAYMAEGIIVSLNLFRLISPKTRRVSAIRGFTPNKGIFHELVFRKTLQKSHLVTVNAKHLADEMKNRFHVQNSRVQLIHNGVTSVATNLDLRHNPPNIIVIANFHKYKGHRFLLQALSKINLDFKCFLIGDGIEKKKLQTKINDLGLNKKVVMPEQILNVAPFLRMSQIAIHPSETEGLSNAILEEMSWGLPIIAFNVGGNSELIRNNINGFLVNLPGQPGATAPTFTLTIVPAMINPPQQPSWGFSCNGVPFLGCLGSMLGHVFINDFFFSWINYLSSNISYWFSSYVMTFGWGYLDQLSQYINSAMNSLADNNPIVGLAEMGVQLINFTSQMFVTMILEGIEEAIFTLGLALPAVIIVWVIVGTWMGIYVGIGFMTAYYVPMIPYMTFLFGSIGWVIAVIEAMVAAPIMAVGMTYPEGENIFGKGEAGFMILLNVFLRPSLMIIGYIAAIALSYVVVWMLNSGFSQSQSFYGGLGSTTPGAPFFAVSIGLSYTSWASTFVYFFSTLVYTMLYWVSVEKSFTLIYLLPDQILRWIGGQSEHIGAEAARWEQEVKQQVQKGTEGSANFMMSSPGSGDGGDGGEESSGDGSSSSSGKAPVK
jgi:glycosyltransferase involved in cell wall biosynthesis